MVRVTITVQTPCLDVKEPGSEGGQVHRLFCSLSPSTTVQISTMTSIPPSTELNRHETAKEALVGSRVHPSFSPMDEDEEGSGEQSEIESERALGGWTPEELKVLNGALEEWLNLDGSGQKKAAIRQVVKVLREVSSDIVENGLNERVKGWLKRAARPRRRFTGGKKPTLREVVGFLWAEKIKTQVATEFGVLPGQKAFVGKWAVVLSDIMKDLSLAEREGFEREAVMWARRGPPKEKRRR